MATRARILRVLALAKTVVFRNMQDMQDSLDSPTFAKPCWQDSPDSPTFAKGHFWEKCDSPWHICTSNSPFSQIWGEWPLLNFTSSSVKCFKVGTMTRLLEAWRCSLLFTKIRSFGCTRYINCKTWKINLFVLQVESYFFVNINFCRWHTKMHTVEKEGERGHLMYLL